MIPFLKRLNFAAPSVVPVQQMVTIASAGVAADVEEYVGMLETEESAVWCKCVWRVHPDDQNVKPGNCRDCGAAKNVHIVGEGFHRFAGIRRVRIDTHPACPVHTKEGLIIGFLEWMTKRNG